MNHRTDRLVTGERVALREPPLAAAEVVGAPGEALPGLRRPALRPHDRVSGVLLGLAVGDALGMAVEGAENDSTIRAIRRLGGIRDFLAPQPHVLRSLRRLRPGCWTDETQLAVCMVRAIVERGTLDYDAIAASFVYAFETLELRGWDTTTKQACRRLAQGTHRTRSGQLGGCSNAVAARIAPVAAWSCMAGDTREQLLHHCIAVGTITHYDPRAITGAYVIAQLVRDGLAAARKWEPSPSRYDELVAEARWAESVLARGVGVSDEPLSQHMEEVSDAVGSPAAELAELCDGAGSDVRQSVPFVAALLCSRPWEFDEGVIAAVNAGGDTDSNGAMVGAVLGGAWGIRKMPRRFVEKLEETEIIRELAIAFGNLGAR